MNTWKDRIRAALIHLGISVLIALLASALVFGLWYPYPYREISGGRELFFIVVAVDVILGPLLTLAVFNRAKPWRVLRIDLGLIALLQMLALAYGLWTVSLARPIHLVFEVDRFRVIHAIEVPENFNGTVHPEVDAKPLWGPTIVAARALANDQEKSDATKFALEGVALAARPDYWQPYALARERVLQKAKPVALLKQRFPQQAAKIDALLMPYVSANQGKPDTLVYLPMAGRKEIWTVFLDPQTAKVLAFMPLDSF